MKRIQISISQNSKKLFKKHKSHRGPSSTQIRSTQSLTPTVHFPFEYQEKCSNILHASEITSLIKQLRRRKRTSKPSKRKNSSNGKRQWKNSIRHFLTTRSLQSSLAPQPKRWLTVAGIISQNLDHQGKLFVTKLRSLLEGFHKSKELTPTKLSPHSSGTNPLAF